ncbi:MULTISPECIES: RbsD/FucU domain-containing protein [unclassified Devosia]|jgi:L-fucose mutarotase|uniref:RbsD/FucU family protein n=1 Tax=unclassified Devosia TaxID=196773 RepID=UPI00086CD466|nr:MULTISPECIES: RbsD/FucU domain-containing protein [unclassified Devosia]MBN9363340.1 ribose ABC transporter [Devosia sp.]ODS80799.1 MAG: ribose ABC transporter [Devosia sp. SCN 66-27]OJX25172.1 MAG: ribose ABC transporter [Devosia sp. 66-14]
MLKGIPPILGPDLLYILRAMGHGDEIAIVDANYPGDSAGPQLVRLDGISASEVLDAILTVMPLDTFVDEQAFGMEVVGDAKKREETHKDFAKLIKKHEPGMKLSLLERFAFYERVHGAYAVVQTGERRLYGNVLLKKGIVRPE